MSFIICVWIVFALVAITLLVFIISVVWLFISVSYPGSKAEIASKSDYIVIISNLFYSTYKSYKSLPPYIISIFSFTSLNTLTYTTFIVLTTPDKA